MKPLKVLVIAVGLSFAFSMSPPARAIPVECLNCSNTFTQILEYFKQAEQYIKQTEQYLKQVQQWEIQVKMGKPLTSMQFDNALSMVRTIEGIMQSGSQITYNVNNLQQRFYQDYPTVSESFNRLSQMGGVSREPTTMWTAFFRDDRSVKQNQDMLVQAMMALKAQSTDLTRDQQMISSANSGLMGSLGHEQAIESTALYAHHSAQQLMKLRQGLALMTQLAIQEQSDRVRQEALTRGAQQKWLSTRPGNAARTPRRASDF